MLWYAVDMIYTLSLIFKQKRSVVLFFVLSILILGVLSLISQLPSLTALFTLFPVTNPIFWSTLGALVLNTFATQNVLGSIILILFSFFLSLNIIVFFTYLKHYRLLLKGAGAKLGLIGIIFGAFGAGCLSCGVLLLAPLISIIGISSTSWVLEHNLLISIIGLLLVAGSTILLLRKLSQPEVCEVLLN